MNSFSPRHDQNRLAAIGRSICPGLSLLGMAAFLLSVSAGLAAQPNANMAAALSVTAPQPLRATTDAQRKLAAAAAAEGVQIEWNAALGTPFSIRGKNLGERQTYSAGKGLKVAGSAQPEVNAIAVLDNLSGIMGSRDAQTEFTARPSEGDALGFRHVRAEQKYKGLKVFGGEVIVHFNKGGEVYQVNGRYVPDIAVDTTPGLDPAKAASLAMADLAGLDKSGAAIIREPELVVFAYQTQPRLAYALTLTADPQPENAWRYWIDAQDGKVLMRYNDVKTAEVMITGTILTGEGGTTNTVWGYNIDTNYYLFNFNNLWVIYNNSAQGPDAHNLASRISSTWLPEDRVEMSAAINFDNIQSYYWMVFGRNSYDDKGSYAWVNVHDYEANNASWNSQEFYFGDGDGMYTGPFGVLDICGHEFTHAVTEYSANLIYAYEPGALNESFSDIFGACVEFAYQPDGRTNYPGKRPGTADWLHGEDCATYYIANRDMSAPSNTATVGSGNEQPIYYKGQYWYPGDFDNGGVHRNSGVQNYFFYLLSDGMTNEYFDWNSWQWVTNVVVAGIGVDNAAQIAYRALTVYCTPYTDYTDIRAAWISAAQDFDAAWVLSVTQAWGQVGYGSYTAANLGTALNATYLTWWTAGDSNWFAQTNVMLDGVMAAQSGRIKNGQQSRLQTTVTGPGTFSFWWKVSSELDWDYLRFLIEGNEQAAISGEADWAFQSIYLGPGTYTIAWIYTKDFSVSAGMDAGWVDQVAWAPVWTPAVPTIAATKDDFADKIRITWPAISGATDYLLYRNTIDNSGQAQLIATLTNPIYDDYEVVPGTVYYYWMKARNCATVTSLSNMDKGYRKMLAPTALAASKGDYTTNIRLTWVAALGATSYQIFRNTSPDPNTASAIIETGLTSYNDATAVPAITYYYWLTSRKWRPDTNMYTTSFSVGDYGWRRSMASTDNALCDFDGDGKADAAVYQRTTGQWAIMMSANLFRTSTFQLGGTGYMPVPQDYDGDGKTDVAVYSSATGQWIALLSASGYAAASASMGEPGSIPLPRDFDGDGKADPAVYHQPSGLWKTLLSSQRYVLAMFYYGDYSYGPYPADYDNDGKTDPALFQVRREVMGELGHWFAALSASAYTTRNWTLGKSGQLPIPQDYDGDRKADTAMYDAVAGLWSYLPSSIITAVPYSLNIGGTGFIAVAGDYDGDKKADAAVYQESTGTWLVLPSGNIYAPCSVVFGGPGYQPAAPLQ